MSIIRHNAFLIDDFQRSGMKSLDAFIIEDAIAFLLVINSALFLYNSQTLAGALGHLVVLGAIMGLLLGLLGGALGKVAYLLRKKMRARSI